MAITFESFTQTQVSYNTGIVGPTNTIVHLQFNFRHKKKKKKRAISTTTPFMYCTTFGSDHF